MPQVLIVDDEPNIRTLVRRVLQTLGYEVIEAANGRAALDRIQQHPPDLVFTDLSMPEMNGLQLLEHLGNGFPHLPIIVMSAYPDQMRKVCQTGAYNTLPKPFVYSDLITLVDQVLPLPE